MVANGRLMGHRDPPSVDDTWTMEPYPIRVTLSVPRRYCVGYRLVGTVSAGCAHQKNTAAILLQSQYRALAFTQVRAHFLGLSAAELELAGNCRNEAPT